MTQSIKREKITLLCLKKNMSALCITDRNFNNAIHKVLRGLQYISYMANIAHLYMEVSIVGAEV
jgi:hypothetical protein